MRTKAILSAAMLLSLAACGVPEDAPSTPKSLLSGNPGEVPILGMGYDPIGARLTGLRCIAGARVVDEEARTADVTVAKDFGYDDLSRALNGKIGVSVPVYPGINATGTAEFATEYSKTTYSDAFTVMLEASIGGKRLYVDDAVAGDVALAATAQRIKSVFGGEGASPADLAARYRDACGLEYVAYAQFGMSLIAVLKVDYQNEYDKLAFGGSIGAELLDGHVSGSVDLAFERLRAGAKARVSLLVHQRGGDPVELLSILGDAQAEAGGLFLQCDFNNYRHCIAVFRAVLRHARAIAAEVRDGGLQIQNAMPLVYETAAYPTIGALREISADGPQPIDIRLAGRTAELMDGLRRRLVRAEGQALADLRRAADVRTKLAIVLSALELSKIADVESAARALLDAARAAKVVCDDTAGVLVPEDTGPCEAQVVAVEGKAGYDTTPLSLDPRTFLAWCVLAHDTLIVNMSDKLTVRGMLKAVNRDLLPVHADDPEMGRKIQDHCLSAAAALTALSSLHLDRDPGAAAPPTSSLRPLATLPNLTEVSARNQFLGSAEGLKQLPRLADVTLDGNYFTSLGEFRGWAADPTGMNRLGLARNHVTALVEPGDTSTLPFFWKEIDLSDNDLTTAGPIPAPSLRTLDLSDNPLTSFTGAPAAWAELLPSLETLKLHGIAAAQCPLPEQAICSSGD